MARTNSGRLEAAGAGKLSAGIALGLLLTAVGCAGSRRTVLPATELPLVTSMDVARPTEPDSAQDAPRLSYVVKPGDTLWRIATSYRLSVEELAQANGIEDPARLRAGTSLWIPGAFAAEGPQAQSLSGPRHPSFCWPVRQGRILSGYGAPRRERPHQGLDIGGAQGEPVLAAEHGSVVYSGSGMRGYGKTVIIDHGGSLQTLYAHNSELLVRKGDRVERGQVVARLGRTGNASTDHCHFEVRSHEVPVDPLRYVSEPALLTELR